MAEPGGPRRPNAKSAQREATRRRLLDAARRLFAAHGYGGVSTTEIAREAGVTHGLIHAHFHSKAGLLFEIISEGNALQEEAARVVAGSDADCRTRLRDVVDVYLRHDLADLELLGVMQAYSWQWPYDLEARNQAQLADVLQPVRTVLEDAVAAGELRADLDLDRAVRAFFAIYTLCLRDALFAEASVEDCAREICAQLEVLLSGACARSPATKAPQPDNGR